ncbi:hypothetical protein SAMN04488691_102107 [Haloferax larsenii]|uniref:Uncharacterized protein n=1 Tax=Haloferax larsenii TaxID=302484 RepID=A0A1H7KTA2_HALLR|nr:hypothetical protein SAMN04488691_102107 [Haloferax larsenii]
MCVLEENKSDITLKKLSNGVVNETGHVNDLPLIYPIFHDRRTWSNQ